jgi:hypothetical protein
MEAMKNMMSPNTTDSKIKIPAEWIEKIEKRKINPKLDFDKLDEFILLYYPSRSISAIADCSGHAHSTVCRRIAKLKQEGRIK